VSQKLTRPISCRFNTLFHWANERNQNSSNYWKAILSFCSINQLTLAGCCACRDCFSVEQAKAWWKWILLLWVDSYTCQSFYNQFWLHPLGIRLPSLVGQLKSFKITKNLFFIMVTSRKTFLYSDLTASAQADIDPQLEFGKESIFILNFPNRPVWLLVCRQLKSSKSDI
jgi:hypothetical protein